MKRNESILALCESLSMLTGYSVEPSTRISDLGVTSLEMLQVVVSLGDAGLIEAFSEFFESTATPMSVWDAAYAA